MKTTIEVANRREGELIREGLEDPLTRAMVQVMGALRPLSDRARARVLAFVADQLEETREGR